MNNLQDDCLDTVEAEIQLTSVLVEIEQVGLHVDKLRIGKDAIKRIPNILNKLEEELKVMTGKYFRPHVNSDCHDILCSHFGAPVLNWTKGSKKKAPEPSFDKDTLKIYETYPEIPEGVVSRISEYRHFHQLLGTFTKPYLFKSKKRRMHGSFNQCVRTGRMSMSDPNMQQTSPDAKKYIIPTQGYYLADFDLSQIEYRYVVTYTENPAILKAYREDPDADYHQIMADLCGIDRAPAKNMNFAASFRCGKGKTISMLRAAFKPEDVPDGMSFDDYVNLKGNHVFNLYHERHPELRVEWNAAQLSCKRRGYCRNVWGRRRHLIRKASYMAFPNIIQSSAADLMKRITVRLQNLIRDKGPRLICIVHDSWLLEIPTGEEQWEEEIKQCIEATESRLKVPLYTSCSTSTTHWGDCK
jgi:DNA polymerase-1